MNLRIRNVVDADYEGIAEIFSFPEVIAQTSQEPNQPAAFWRDLYQSYKDGCIERIADVDGKVAGHLTILLNARERRKHVASFGIAVHPQFQRMGVGRALMEDLIDIADNQLELVRVELNVFADNARAIRLYQRFGFDHEGRQRKDVLRNGELCDGFRMARIRA